MAFSHIAKGCHIKQASKQSSKKLKGPMEIVEIVTGNENRIWNIQMHTNQQLATAIYLDNYKLAK